MSNKKPKAVPESQQYTILPKQSVRLIGEISGFDDLPNDVIGLLCEEVNYRIREVTQLGLDIMKQAKRKKLLVTDINLALENLDVQPVLGYGASSEQVTLVPLQEDDLFYAEEKSVNLLEALSVEIPVGYSENPSVKRSWLAVEGRLVPESSEAGPVCWPSPTEDEKKYLDVITSNLFQVDDDQKKEILKNIHKSCFLNRLLPHILDFLEKVEREAASDVRRHVTAVDFLRTLVTNPHVNLLFTPFLDVVVNIIHRCQVGVHGDSMDVWDLQESASLLMSSIIRLWDSPLNNLRDSHEEFLLGILSSPSQPLFCYYGAVVGLLSLKIQSLEKALPLMFNVLQQTLNDSSSFHPTDVTRMLEVSKLALEKLLRHHTIEGTSSVQSDCTVVDDSSHPKTPLKDAYAFFQELFGDSLSIKLPCIDFSSKNTSSQEQVTLVLPGKELPEMTGDSLLSGLMDEGKDRSSTEDVAIKATLSDPLHGIKLKISKCSKQTKDVVLESASDGTFGETKSKKASSGSKRNSSSVITSEMFDEMPLKNREDVIISFRFRNQSNLNTFTEKKKAQILARNMTRQYASTSRYRELCNNLKPYSKSSLLFKQLHTKNVGLHSFVPNAACMV